MDELERLVTRLARALDAAAELRPADLERLRGIGGAAAVRTLVAICRARRDERLTSSEAVEAVEAVERGGWAQVAGRLGPYHHHFIAQ